LETNIDSPHPEEKACIQCGLIIIVTNKFCNHCGAAQYASSQLEPGYRWMLIKQAAFYYLLDLSICFMAFADILRTLSGLIIFDIISAFIAIGFFAYNWAGSKTILQWKSFSLPKLAAYCAIAIIASTLVQYAVGWLNVTIFSRDVYYYNFFEGYHHSALLLVFFTAIFPAIFEELAYRGYLLQVLLKVADKQQAVYISSLLFAFIHFSFISLFWLVPFALFLGFTCVKEKTMWYGVCIHFCFNMTACVFELLHTK
jgi:uncharacterized protein